VNRRRWDSFGFLPLFFFILGVLQFGRERGNMRSYILVLSQVFALRTSNTTRANGGSREQLSGSKRFPQGERYA